MNTVILSAAEKNWFNEDLTNRKIKTFERQQNSKKQIPLRKRSEQKKVLRKFVYHPRSITNFKKVFKEFNITLQYKSNSG